MLNTHFLPVYVDGTYLQANSDTEADELAAYRELFTELNRANDKRQQAGQPRLSIGMVHAYVFAPDGRALDSRHVAHAGPASVMKHPFCPGRDDDNFVTATIIGLVEFDPAKPQIHSLQIATDGATYGASDKRLQPFGVAVRIVP